MQEDTCLHFLAIHCSKIYKKYILSDHELAELRNTTKL